MATKMQEKYTVIFDDTCPLCSKSVRWLVGRFKEERFDLVPCNSREREARYPEMSKEECESAMQLVTPDGTLLSGDAAILEILKSDITWWPLTVLWKIPFVNLLIAGGYRWVARNRHLISSHFFQSRKG